MNKGIERGKDAQAVVDAVDIMIDIFDKEASFIDKVGSTIDQAEESWTLGKSYDAQNTGTKNVPERVVHEVEVDSNGDTSTISIYKERSNGNDTTIIK